MKLSIFIILGALTGVAGCLIPWGQASGFHGIGLPVPTVLWNNPKGLWVEYPNPSAYLMNPIAGATLGCLLFGAIRLGSLVSRYFQKTS